MISIWYFIYILEGTIFLLYDEYVRVLINYLILSIMTCNQNSNILGIDKPCHVYCAYIFKHFYLRNHSISYLISKDFMCQHIHVSYQFHVCTCLLFSSKGCFLFSSSCVCFQTVRELN